MKKQSSWIEDKYNKLIENATSPERIDFILSQQLRMDGVRPGSVTYDLIKRKADERKNKLKSGGAMNKQILKKLARLANHLDKKGAYKEAQYVDGIIKEAQRPAWVDSPESAAGEGNVAAVGKGRSRNTMQARSKAMSHGRGQIAQIGGEVRMAQPKQFWKDPADGTIYALMVAPKGGVSRAPQQRPGGMVQAPQSAVPGTSPAPTPQTKPSGEMRTVSMGGFVVQFGNGFYEMRKGSSVVATGTYSDKNDLKAQVKAVMSEG